MPAFFIIFRLVISDPQNFGCCEACHSRIGCNLNHTFCADFICHFLAFLCGTLVTPDNGIADNLIIFIQHHETVHLTGQADSFDLVFRDTAFLHDSFDSCKSGFTPVSRILFSVAVFRLIHGIFYCMGSDNFSEFIKQNCFCTACSQIHTNEISHKKSPP